MSKMNLLVLFGGQSSEHEVSIKSALTVMGAVNRDKYQVIPVIITKDGRWLYVKNQADIQKISDSGTGLKHSDKDGNSGNDCAWDRVGLPATLSVSKEKRGLYVFGTDHLDFLPVDVAFPVLHGLNGEDGTIQGLFEIAGIPYVGCGVLASGLGMDKFYTKIVVDTLGIRQAQYVGVHRQDLSHMEETLDRVEKKLAYPVFVKPSCAGSSVGVHKAENRKELAEALTDAAKYDAKILVEETIIGRELECGVFEDQGEITPSGVGEILAAAEFYDFDAKYNNASSKTDVAPQLPEGTEEEIRKDAAAIFAALGAHSLSRVDFFLDQKGVVFNEINTLPGFTAISMYPMLFAHKGLEKPELVEKLIQSAFHRAEH